MITRLDAHAIAVWLVLDRRTMYLVFLVGVRVLLSLSYQENKLSATGVKRGKGTVAAEPLLLLRKHETKLPN